MIRAAAGTVLGGALFLALLELTHPAEVAARAWIRKRRERPPPPAPGWTAARAGF